MIFNLNTSLSHGIRFSRRGRIVPLAGIVFYALSGMLFFVNVAWTQEKKDSETTPSASKLRLIDQQPRDIIHLKDTKRTILRVVPLELPGRILPKEFPKSGQLIVRLLENPLEDYTLQWRVVDQIFLFEKDVLAEAQGLVKENKFDEAYEYFQFLLRDYPRMEELPDALGQFYLAEAKYWRQENKPAVALGVLNQLFTHNPSFPELKEVLGEVVNGLIQEYLTREDFSSARALRIKLEEKFPGHEISVKWQNQWIAQAKELLAQAQGLFKEKKYPEAQDTALKSFHIWPDLPNLKALLGEIYKFYPRLLVGVNQAWAPPDKAPNAKDNLTSSSEFMFLDWSVRRAHRLLNRDLVEYESPGPEGGIYQTPLGDLEVADVGRTLIIRLRKQETTNNSAPLLTGYDLAREFWQLADPKSPSYRPQWKSLLESIEVQNVREIHLQFSRPYVQPMAILETSLRSLEKNSSSDNNAFLSTTPFQNISGSESSLRFRAQENYFASIPGQPQEIIERHYPRGRSGILALKRGEVQILDRINPWDLSLIRDDSSLVLKNYAIPTVHCLLPNRNKPFVRSRVFRRALEYGIDRERILKHHLLKEQEIPGCQQISGPFSAGKSFDDPLRYGYNNDIRPRPYDPRLSITLATVALRQEEEEAKKEGKEPPKELPALTLAHPPNEIALTACEAIQKHLAALNITVNLREMLPGELPLADPLDDLVYVEMMIREPLVDIRHLFGPKGILGEGNPYLSQALENLDSSTNWNQARDRLRQIHRLLHEDATVVPLWQLVDHFAHHQSIQGIVPASPVTLYQHVEQWKAEFQVSPNTP